MSECHLQWLVMITGPRTAAEWRSSSQKTAVSRRTHPFRARCSDLGNELVTIIQQSPLPHNETAKWIHPFKAFFTATIMAVLCEGQGQHLEVLVDCSKFVC